MNLGVWTLWGSDIPLVFAFFPVNYWIMSITFGTFCLTSSKSTDIRSLVIGCKGYTPKRLRNSDLKHLFNTQMHSLKWSLLMKLAASWLANDGRALVAPSTVKVTVEAGSHHGIKPDGGVKGQQGGLQLHINGAYAWEHLCERASKQNEWQSKLG